MPLVIDKTASSCDICLENFVEDSEVIPMVLPCGEISSECVLCLIKTRWPSLQCTGHILCKICSTSITSNCHLCRQEITSDAAKLHVDYAAPKEPSIPEDAMDMARRIVELSEDIKDVWTPAAMVVYDEISAWLDQHPEFENEVNFNSPQQLEASHEYHKV